MCYGKRHMYSTYMSPHTQTFFSGDVVSGLLHFTLTEAKSYKYIEIRLSGGARVRWTETHRETTTLHTPEWPWLYHINANTH